MASSSSNPLRTFDVFLSFCGKDTRKNIVSHLYQELGRQGITTFKDDKELERGAYITPALFEAIRCSKIAIVILSENYAFSSFCLQELAEIMEQRKNGSLDVLPIFYNIDPSIVRKTKGKLQEAFDEHRRENSEKIESWKEALTQAADTVGDHSINWKDEAELIKVILKDLNAKLIHRMSRDYSQLVGMDVHMKSLWPLLSLESQDEVRLIGICGMGGIGKTTIAKHVLTTIHNYFQASCFIQDVKKIHTEQGERHLQLLFLSQILGTTEMSIPPYVDVCSVIKERLRHRRVLAVLDDVNKIDQLKCLVGANDWFGPGSRIIITSRCKKLLPPWDGCYIYEASYLKHEDAVKLFRQYAFNGEPTGIECLQLSDRAATYASGLPLALKIWGSYLRELEMTDWEAAMEELTNNLALDIKSVLKVSFDALEEKAKDIFLYLACYFKEGNLDWLDSLLSFKHRNVKFWIRMLHNRSLVDLLSDTVRVHDVLQEMGKDIVCEQCDRPVGTRQFLIKSSEICDVLEHETGTEKVEVVSLHDLEVDRFKIGRKAFQKMHNLRFLSFSGFFPSGKLMYETEEVEYLPPKLVQLRWDGFPMSKLPRKFNPVCLVELKMSGSNIERLWDGAVFFPHLQELSLEDSKKLEQCPDLKMVPNLEKLNLCGCTELVEVPCSNEHQRLSEVNFRNCWRLKHFPRWENMKALRRLILHGCKGLKKFPIVSTNIHDLDLKGTGIEELPSTVGLLYKLGSLNMSHTGLKELPSSIGLLPSLFNLNVSHTGIKELPSSIGCLPNLMCLNVAHTKIWSLPSMDNIIVIYVEDCKQLRSVPKLPDHGLLVITVATEGFFEVLKNAFTICKVHGIQTEKWELDEFPVLEIVQDEDEPSMCTYHVHIQKPQNHCLVALFRIRRRRVEIVTPKVIFESDNKVTLQIRQSPTDERWTKYHPMFVDETDKGEDWGKMISTVWEEYEGAVGCNRRKVLEVDAHHALTIFPI